MTVSNNTAAATQANSAGGSGSLANAIGSNGDITQMFTTLLVAQIKNQDPTQPSDPSQYVTQLAQLSQLQSLQTLSTQGGTSNSVLQGLQAMTLGEQVGAQVGVTTSSLALGSAPVDGSFTLQNAASSVSVVLTDASGSQHSFALGSRSAGQVAFEIDPSKLGLAPGNYSVSVDAASGESPQVQVLGTIQSVTNDPANGVTVTVSNMGAIPVSQIQSYNGWPAAN